MNSPTHIIAGAVATQVVLVALGSRSTRAAQMTAGIGCVILGMASHLLLDLVPHYNWVIYVNWLRKVPHGWLWREAFFSIPVIVLAVYCGRDHPVLNFLGLFGSMYPDFEKVAFLDFHWPQRLVLFPWHSLQCTAYDGRHAMSTYIAEEFAIFGLLATATIGLSVWRMRKGGISSGDQAMVESAADGASA